MMSCGCQYVDVYICLSSIVSFIELNSPLHDVDKHVMNI